MGEARPVWAVDLAPRHKMGLPLRSRVILGPGTVRLGFPHQIMCSLEGVGAMVTGPWTWERHWGPYPVLVERPGGILWVPERPRRSLPQVLEELVPFWQQLEVAVLAALAPGEVAHTEAAAQHLAETGVVAGLWLEVAEEEDTGHILARISAARERSGLPVLVVLPLARAADLAVPCLHAGADALVVGMPPAGELARPEGWARGRLYGPLVFPLMLAALRRVVRQLRGQAPVIAQGGIHSPADAVLSREAGADAVALDAAVWVEPDLPTTVGRALEALEKSPDAEEASHASRGAAGE